MAPRRKNPQIVRSGNAGNSSKSSPLPSRSSTPAAAKPADAAAQPERVHLFPPGSKTPLNLLYERCQKNGWEKPEVEPRRRSKGFTAVVTLRKANKKDAFKVQSVRMEPHPALEKDTALEAKHWAATYALHRFCNNLSLNRVLPPGPKEYWSELEIAQKSAPAHQAWQYDPDPFAAALQVEVRQREKEKARSALNGTGEAGSAYPSDATSAQRPKLSKAWTAAPEVRMAPALRELTEQTVRQMMAVFSDVDGKGDAESDSGVEQVPVNVDLKTLAKELRRLGFRQGHVDSALNYLVQARSALANPTSSESKPLLGDALLQTMANVDDREAALQYLTVVVPEDDQPVQFRPSSASAPLITSATSASAGEEGLRLNWTADMLVRRCGFPRPAVLDTLKGQARGHAGVAIELMCRTLAGWAEDEEWGTRAAVQHIFASVDGKGEDESQETIDMRTERRMEERSALEAIFGPDRVHPFPGSDTDFEISMPSSSNVQDSIALYISFHPLSKYPSVASPLLAPPMPTFFVTSETLPAYLRLALTASLLKQLRSPDSGWLGMLEAGEGGVIFEMVNHLEETWEDVVQHPPDVREVTMPFLPKAPPTSSRTVAPPDEAKKGKRPLSREPRAERRAPRKALEKNASLDEQLVDAQKAMQASHAFQPILKGRKSLPAWDAQETFLASVASNRVVVVSGETGSGKTTQLPQFLLDHEIASGRGSTVSIVCTQPRRVAALGVASRVASERLEDIDKADGLVGYAIRGERRATAKTRLLFATTGVLLRRLATGDRELSGISHIFIDEVHERSVDGDLLMLELRELLNRRHDLTVILMSATANQEQFAAYFGEAPSVIIPGITYPVEDLYLEDVIKMVTYQPPVPPRTSGKDAEDERQSRRRKFEAMGLPPEKVRALESLSQATRVDEGLVAACVEHILQSPKKGAVLIFMPGVAEIMGAIREIKRACGERVVALPLHSQLSNVEQRSVFAPVPNGAVKVIVATNVAEASITIPDVCWVLDSGRAKETVLDPAMGMVRLVETWCSRASSRQRRGRAGRTKPGIAFKLFTREQERKQPAETRPEMLRTSLESVVLQIKATRDDEDIRSYLAKAISPPSQAALDTAITTLKNVGALNDNHRLTSLGKQVAQLPLDVRLGKLLILGAIFHCLDPVLTLAAILSAGKPLFNAPFDKREDANAARARFQNGQSDFLTDVRVFQEYSKLQGGFKIARQFCEDNFMSPSTLRDVSSLRIELLGHLKEQGYVDRTARTDRLDDVNQNGDNTNLVSSLVAAAFYNVARIALPAQKYEKTAEGTLAKDAEARSFKFFDEHIGRVFLHPSSILFSASSFSSTFLTYFSKSASGQGAASKVYLRGASVVPLFGLLLLYGGAGQVKLHSSKGGISIGSGDDGKEDEGWLKMRASVRIGVLVNHLRVLLDRLLGSCVDNPHRLVELEEGEGGAVVQTMLQLIAKDGLA